MVNCPLLPKLPAMYVQHIWLIFVWRPTMYQPLSLWPTYFQHSPSSSIKPSLYDAPLQPPQWKLPLGLCLYSCPARNLFLSAKPDLLSLPKCTFFRRLPMWMNPRPQSPFPSPEFPLHTHISYLLLSTFLLLFSMHSLVSQIEMWAPERQEPNFIFFFYSDLEWTRILILHKAHGQGPLVAV